MQKGQLSFKQPGFVNSLRYKTCVGRKWLNTQGKGGSTSMSKGNISFCGPAKHWNAITEGIVFIWKATENLVGETCSHVFSLTYFYSWKEVFFRQCLRETIWLEFFQEIWFTFSWALWSFSAWFDSLNWGRRVQPQKINFRAITFTLPFINHEERPRGRENRRKRSHKSWAEKNGKVEVFVFSVMKTQWMIQK